MTTNPNDPKKCMQKQCGPTSITTKDTVCTACSDGKVSSPNGRDCVKKVVNIYDLADSDKADPSGLSIQEWVAYMQTEEPNASINVLQHQFYDADKDDSFTISLTEFKQAYNFINSEEQ